MEHPVRRKDREISREQAMQLLQAGEYGVLSTADGDGLPYGIPLSYVVLGDAIYFHCALEGRKLGNLEAQSKVSFCVVGAVQAVYDGSFGTQYESAVVSGTAAKVEDAGERRESLIALCEKYLPAHREHAAGYVEKAGPRTLVYKVTMDSITGKARRPKP